MTSTFSATTAAPLRAHRLFMQPGWHSSGPQHWQTLWEQRRGARAQRVEQADWEHPQRAAWVATLRNVVLAEADPAILLAHSIGCIALAHLLADPSATELRERLAAAILVAPADVERDGAAPELDSFRPVPMQPLGVPALVIASTDDSYCTLTRAQSMARAWHADFHQISGAGHINADSGYGPWPEGRLLIESWLAGRGLAVTGEGDRRA